MSFANYAAGAIMMPYGKFLRAAEEHRYAIDRLCGQFGANVEQVAHRFTTLGRSGARGVPFFMLRVDPAGNISKRYAGERFPFSHSRHCRAGTCTRFQPGQRSARSSRRQTASVFSPSPDDRTADPPDCATNSSCRRPDANKAPGASIIPMPDL